MKFYKQFKTKDPLDEGFNSEYERYKHYQVGPFRPKKSPEERRAARNKAKREQKRRQNSPEGQDADIFLFHRKRNLVRRRKRAAIKRGLEFTITHESLVWPEICPILGIPLDYFTRGSIKPNLPTIDRVDPRYGYHAWNARIVSFKANSLKNACTKEHLEMILDYVRRVEAEKPKDAGS